MPITLNENNRIAHRWNGTNFVEEVLTLTGADGITVSFDATQFTISGNEAALSGALTTAFTDADTALSGALVTGYTDADTALSGALQTNIDAKVNKAGDTMTGLLVLSADPTDALHAATKQYVDASAATAAIEVKEEASTVASGARFIDFTHALDVATSSSGVTVAVDETELTSVVFLTGDQNIAGNKTFEDAATFLGDLNVSGTVNSLNSQQLLIEDNVVVLNSTVTGTPVLDARISVERGTSADAYLLWNESTDAWQAGVSGSLDDIVLLGTLNSTIATVSGDLVSGYTAADTALSGALVTGYTDADTALSGALVTAFTDADTALSGALVTGYTDADTALSGALQTNIDAKLDKAGDTMTGDLTLASGADILSAVSGINVIGEDANPFKEIHLLDGFVVNAPTVGTHIVNKDYVDAQVSSAAVEVQEDNAQVLASASTLDFQTGLDVTFSGSRAIISVDDSELTNVVHLTGNETISGTKTFTSPVVLASGATPSGISDTGTEGEIRWADDYLYVCVGTDSWKRVALAQF